VTAVYDGDTIKVRFLTGKERRVRLIGIDSAEIGDKREKKSFHAYLSKRVAFYYLYRKEIRLTYDKQLEDEYGRILAYIWLKRDILFNEFILREGYASVFLKFPFRKDFRTRFQKAEKMARTNKKGLWMELPYPVIPTHEANKYIGKLVSVEYFCEKIQRERKLVFLRSPDKNFSALISRSSLDEFKDIESYEGKRISIYGFVESYRGQPQIMLFFPRQIQIKENKE